MSNEPTKAPVKPSIREHIIKVPVKPVVKAYLEYNFGPQVRIDKYSLAGRFFHYILEKNIPYKEKNPISQNYKCMVEVVIPDDTFLRYGHSLTNNSIRDFNEFVTCQFYSLLVFHMKYQEEEVTDKLNYKKCILRFCEMFKMSEEIISYETVKKYYYRSRAREEERISNTEKSFGKIVPDDL